MVLDPTEITFIPANTRGKAVDLEQHVTSPNIDEATDVFLRGCKRLLTPSVWREITGIASASFTLITEDSTPSLSTLKVNDMIRVDIPGPGNATGKGYDWVKVTAVKNNIDPGADESLGITLFSAPAPGSEAMAGVAHFLREGSSSTFIISRMKAIVRASYHGRNEVPNIHTGNITDNIRNGIVATGAAAGLSELQWNALIKGLLTK